MKTKEKELEETLKAAEESVEKAKKSQIKYQTWGKKCLMLICVISGGLIGLVLGSNNK